MKPVFSGAVEVALPAESGSVTFSGVCVTCQKLQDSLR